MKLISAAILAFAGFMFYLFRPELSFLPSILLYSAPSFIFAFWLVMMCPIFIKPSTQNLTLLLAVILGCEVIQISPLLPEAHFDVFDIIFSVLGMLAGVFSLKKLEAFTPKKHNVGWLKSFKLHKTLGWPIMIGLAWGATVGSYSSTGAPEECGPTVDCIGPPVEPPVCDEAADCMSISTPTNTVTPVLAERSSIIGGITLEDPRTALEFKKLYAYDNFLFAIVQGEGIQVIDNANPELPTGINFINVPGVQDVVIQNGFMVTNHYSDLVVLSLESRTEVNRIQNMYPYKDYIALPSDTYWDNPYHEIDADMVVIGFEPPVQVQGE